MKLKELKGRKGRKGKERKEEKTIPKRGTVSRVTVARKRQGRFSLPGCKP